MIYNKQNKCNSGLFPKFVLTFKTQPDLTFRNFNIFVETHCMRLETAVRKENVDTRERRMQCVSTLTCVSPFCLFN